MSPPGAVGHEVVVAVRERDWVRLAGCLTPDVAFRAVVPSRTEPLREHIGVEAACAQMARWFDGGEFYEMTNSDVHMTADRLHVGYRCHGIDGGTWYTVEQHLFATLADGRISHLNLVCSGFRDIEEPADH